MKNGLKCLNCGSDIIKPIVCDKCFRVKYCSIQCEKDYGEYHYDECLH